MTPIHEYLVSGLLPEDPTESRKIRVKAPQYKLIRGNLYRRSFHTLWLRCVASPQTDDIVKEVHKGSCGFNAEPRSMLVRITKQGYYWPSMHRDAAKRFQILGNSRRTLHKMGGRKTSDRYKRKASRKIRMRIHLYKGLKVTQSFSPITEHMEIMNHIEKQLARSQQGWVDDLAQVLWVHRTLLRNSQKETPFSLTYGSKAIIPISENDVAKDDRGRIKEVDKRRGSKEIALIKEAYYRSKLRRHHNKRSSHSIYKIGDFVLLSQNNTGSTQVWQGPHMVNEVQGKGLYKIADASDHSLTQTTKSTSLGDIRLETRTEDGAAL
ncbi:reverse transcriptase domain-containing protein [Tanacetum coccineum]